MSILKEIGGNRREANRFTTPYRDISLENSRTSSIDRSMDARESPLKGVSMEISKMVPRAKSTLHKISV